jgi:hypothetical protein
MLKLFVRVSDLTPLSTKVTSEFNTVIFKAGGLLMSPIHTGYATNPPFATAGSQTGVLPVPSWDQFASFTHNFVKSSV